jgi:hypothetical protein
VDSISTHHNSYLCMLRYIGVYAGATGGEFELKVKLMEACPNDCFGNGVCVQVVFCSSSLDSSMLMFSFDLFFLAKC